MSYAEIIKTEYPLVIARRKSSDITIADVDVFIKELDAYAASTSGPYVYISYSDGAFKKPSLEVMMHLAKEAEKVNLKYRERSKGFIVVIDSLVSKITFKALSVVLKSLKDWEMVNSLTEAKARARQLLAQ
ncbi:MAG: hypothetical protein ACRC3B_01530 [Bacteroidia bacterium]